MLNQYFLDNTRYVNEIIGAELIKNIELSRKEI
jgi:hypothetical protein